MLPTTCSTPHSPARRARSVASGLVLALALVVAGGGDAAAVKLNAALPMDYAIDAFALTPNGQTAVYALADSGSGYVLRLVAVPVAGGGATTLVDIPVSGAQRSVDSWSITPDGAGVVFLSDKDAQQFRMDLFRVPIDGSAAPLKLNTAPAPNDVDTFRVASDASRVVFEVAPTDEIYSVPTTGGTPVELGTGTGSFLPRYRISPDAARVVFTFDDGMGGGRQIYSVPIDGSQAPLELTNQPAIVLPGENSPQAPAITPDGTTVLFFSRPNAMNPQQYELWATPIAQAAPTKLAGPLAIYFPDFRLTPDGTYAVFTAGTYPAFRLYRVPVDGSTSEQPVSGVGQNVVVSDYAMSPNGQSFAYRAFGGGKYRLFTVSLAGGDDTELTPPVLAGLGAWDHFAFDAASARVVFAAELDAAGVIELYSIPENGGTAVRLSKNPMPASGDVDPAGFTVSPDGVTVIYLADQDTDGVNELFSTGLASGGPQKVHPNLAPNGDVARGAVFTPDGQTIVYLADQESADLLELFATDDPAPGPTPTATSGGGATPSATTTAAGTPTPLATRTPAPEAPDRCDDCLDNDFDGAVDRTDPDCPSYADGAGAGLAGDAAKTAFKCQKKLGKLGTDFATKRVKALSACLQKAFACVQAGGDPACLAKAGAACAKAERARQAAITKVRAAVAKSCGDPPLAAADLGAAAGLGFASEDARCAAFGASLADADGVATCLVAHHACRAEALVGTEIPRARALLVATGRDASLETPCLPAVGPGGAAGDAKPVLKCQKALAKAAAAYGATRLKAGQKCADGVFQCVQPKGNDAACRAKAEAKCAKLAVKITGAAAKLHAALTKSCPALADLAAANGVGFDARSAECAALDTPADSIAGVASCVAAHHACRVDQLLIGQTPRGQELGALTP
ncbi:MAG: hypothetical protein IT293_15045 [Deltaproteobacteria bacterium]|nr:hypothetical protein [Deltaproteobacteria bacterium]